MRQLILGSSSRYRQALLARLGLPFETAVPAISEDAHSGETPDALAARLAASKARAISRSGALVIGSDQVAANDAGILRKPGDFTQALKQLLACQGRPVDFHTAVYLYDQASSKAGAISIAHRCTSWNKANSRSSTTCGWSSLSIVPADSRSKGSALRCLIESNLKTRPH
jgi:predicted house-cleaning NTP pyrophosphatase (Maf/HAM1 superfamily)